MKFHMSLKKARLKRKLTRGELARVSGASSASIAQYESGHAQPPLYMAYRFSQILEFSLGGLDCSKLSSQEASNANYKEKTRKLDKQLNDLLTACNHGV